MLDAFIIEELRRREQRDSERRRPVLEIPCEQVPEDLDDACEDEDEEDSDCGVVIIDYGECEED
jgi:hypothetical protein